MRRSKPSSAIIHPTRLPFSEAEVFRAFRLCFSIRSAKALARETRDAVRDEHWDAVKAEYARAAGHVDPRAINSHMALLQPGLPMLLALVSPELRARVRRQWKFSEVGADVHDQDLGTSFDHMLDEARGDLIRARAAGREPSWVLHDSRTYQA